MFFKKSHFLLCFLIFFVGFPCFARSGDRYISVKEIESKASPSVWGKPGETFFYGDKVQIVEEKNSWLKVSNGKKSGWVKDSCVTSKKLKSGGKVSVNADELALAGKGFSSSLDTEDSSSYSIDFKEVDKMENFKLSEDFLRNFILNGNLNGGE